MNNTKQIELDESSLTWVLNYILSTVKEDRDLVLQHHDTLGNMLGSPPGAEGLSSLEMQLLLNDLSAALNGFMKNAAISVDQVIKVAKILSDHILKKQDEMDEVSDSDRESIEELVKNLNDEKDILESKIEE